MYVLKLNILVPSFEDLDFESEITMKLEQFLTNRKASFISAISEEVIGDNYGQCSQCGCWVSDHSKPDYINSFSNGVFVEKHWLCDLCLPEDHPSAF